MYIAQDCSNSIVLMTTFELISHSICIKEPVLADFVVRKRSCFSFFNICLNNGFIVVHFFSHNIFNVV